MWRRVVQQDGWDIIISDDDDPWVGDEEDSWGSGSWGHEPRTATTAPAANPTRPEDADSSHACRQPDGAALAPALTVDVDEPDTLNCSICFLPLRAPIFQCKVGHMLCLMCHDELKARRKCYICGIPIPEAGYSRCHGMESLVECIRVQCPNAAYGCTIRPAYYDQHSHRQTCPYVPCHCPGEACSFVGSTEALLGHISDVHGWPCTTIKFNDVVTINLREGFNFLLASGDIDGSQGASTAIPIASNQWLFLVNVARQPLECVTISMLCINSHGNMDEKVIECSLSFSNEFGGCAYGSHHQASTFRVACTDLSSRLPDLGECFPFVVRNSVIHEYMKSTEYAIQVKVCIVIR